MITQPLVMEEKGGGAVGIIGGGRATCVGVQVEWLDGRDINNMRAQPLAVLEMVHERLKRVVRMTKDAHANEAALMVDTAIKLLLVAPEPLSGIL